jgi:hypothetical protein
VRSTSSRDRAWSLDEAYCSKTIEERRIDIIRSAACGQGPTFISAKLNLLIAQVREELREELRG